MRVRLGVRRAMAPALTFAYNYIHAPAARFRIAEDYTYYRMKLKLRK